MAIVFGFSLAISRQTGFRLVDAHDADLAHILLTPCLDDVMFHSPPQLLVPHEQHPGRLAHWRTGSPWHSVSASASKSSVKPLPSRAYGTDNCVVLPQAEHDTHGTPACIQASNWKKSRCRQERCNLSCTG